MIKMNKEIYKEQEEVKCEQIQTNKTKINKKQQKNYEKKWQEVRN